MQPPPLRQVDPEELVATQRRYLDLAIYQQDKEYWLDQVQHWPEPLIATHSRQSERARSGVHAREQFRVDFASFAKLFYAANCLHISVAELITALASLVFSRLYDRTDFVLGVELARRSDEQENNTIGLLAHPIPMCVNLGSCETVADVLSLLQSVRRQNYRHRHFPIYELGSAASLARHGRYSLFDAIVNYVPAKFDFGFEDSNTEVANLSYGFPSPWLVTVANPGTDQDIQVTIDTDAGLVPQNLAVSFCSCFEHLVKHPPQHPQQKLRDLQVISGPECNRILEIGRGEKKFARLPKLWSNCLPSKCAGHRMVLLLSAAMCR